MAIIQSLLDTDFYKLTMAQAAFNQFATTEVVYEFKCRNEARWTEEILQDIREEISAYCSLRLSHQEYRFLQGLRFFKSSFLNFLKLYQADREQIEVRIQEGELKIEVNGPWFMTIFFEVPVLAIVNEVYFRHMVRDEKDFGPLMEMGRVRLEEKQRILEKYTAREFTLADFGTRRRFSREWQEEVVRALSDLPTFAGTSNVDLARRLGLTPIGTMAHEFMMVGQAQDDVPLAKFQKKMLQAWVEEYRGDLGIALSDTVGIEAFLRDFDLYFAKLYDGLRHDSGDPLWWAQKVLEHYRSLGIDPQQKVLVFSDGLSPKKAVEITQKLRGQARLSFGIGTNFTNDFPGLQPLQIVMKLTQVNGRPVAKVSDSPGKGMCKDEDFLSYLKKVYGISTQEVD